ncbi:MAG: hypothetical protein JSV37_03980 [Anaerolineaceae bacterium]|nr:MAG: hypothetical protein JSV37_03980 [Anaerolineaceae bacterium]
MEEKTRSEMEKELEKEIEKKVTNWVEVAVSVLISVAVVFVISVVIFKIVWGWVVPDLFPGAVDQGLISADLSWLAAVKLAVLVAVIGGFSPTLTDAFKQRP